MIAIGGHRGSGCTDSPHARAVPLSLEKPAENSLASIEKTLTDGVDFIEVDAIKTLDDQIVVTHSNALADHVFSEANPGFVHEKTLAEVQALKTGIRKDGHTPALAELLTLIATMRPEKGVLPLLNIEIKDVKGSGAPKASGPSLNELLAAQCADFAEHVFFSSFSLQDLKEMAELAPDIPRALLFDTPLKQERPIYGADCSDRSEYLQFTQANIHIACMEAGCSILHPEITSITEETVKSAKEFGCRINSWALNELPPAEAPEPLTTLLRLQQKHSFPCGIITDFPNEVREFVNILHI